MSIFRYKGLDRRIHKIQKGYIGFVQDHHIIPKQHRKHPVILENKFDINSNNNIFIMPNKKGIIKFRMDPRTLVHDGPHHLYNCYVGEKLDEIYNYKDMETQSYYLWLFVGFLKNNLRINSQNIPWN
tara:strand:- start:29 stop:409 length:381 start_codon:yes stop_codon:yes gene_type:complete